MVLDVVAGALTLVGAGLALVAGVGMVRFPDVFARMHAATKPATLGLLLIVIGALLRVDDPGSTVQLLLVMFVQFLTAPVGAHMVGRAAYRAGGLLAEDTVLDELASAASGDGLGSSPPVT
jgi:multicomponent Na+:H+ antiporter subunit G